MNRPPRVLLMGRHFWPHGCVDSAGWLVEIAGGLSRNAVHVEVCTPRYATSWPEKFWFREIPVHRPAVAPRSDWSVGRYTRHLTHWLRQNASSYDVILADAIREEAAAAIEASRSTGCATILRYAGWGRHSDAQFWKTSRAAKRCGSIGRMADVVIAKSGTCGRELLAARYASDRIARIETGYIAGPNRTAASRAQARGSLGLMNGDLKTDADTPIAICNAPMVRDGGITELVHATRHLTDHFPNLRVWLLGDGPHRDWIYDQLRGDGVRASIAMPGSFSELDEVYLAADLYLQTDDFGLDHFLPSAVSAELPIVAVSSESARTVLLGSPTDGADGVVTQPWVRWIDQPTTTSYVEAISAVLNDLPTHRSHAAHLRRHWLRNSPQTSVIDEYVRLIDRVITKKSGTRRGVSVEATP